MKVAGNGTPLGGLPRLRLPLVMPKYLYILGAEKPFSETDVKRIRDELCRLFECTDVMVSGERVFTLHSPLGVKDIERLAAEVTKRFRLQFRAGGKTE